jgi:hypothetical protein
MISVYQSIVPLFICGVFAAFILLQENSNYAPRVYSSLCLKLFLAMLTAFLIYFLLNNIILFLMHLEKTDRTDVYRWGSETSIRKNILSILRYGYTITVGSIPMIHEIAAPFISSHSQEMEDPKRVYEIARIIGNGLLLPAVILFIIQTLKITQKKIPQGRKLLVVLAVIGIPFSILLPAIVGGSMPPVRTLYILPFATAIISYFLIINSKHRIIRRIIICLALAVSIYQGETTAQLFYSDYVRYNYDVALAQDLNKMIQSQTGSDKKLPIALIGKSQASVNFKPNFLRGQVLGQSFFEAFPKSATEASNRGIRFMKTLGMNYSTPSAAQMDEARKAAESMSTYPNEGCIKRLPDVIVIKLSESTYVPRP